MHLLFFFFFFFNDTATTEIYTLSLHDALPILELMSDKTCRERSTGPGLPFIQASMRSRAGRSSGTLHRISDRKSTRLNSSHANISYAVFCLKKKKKNCNTHDT